MKRRSLGAFKTSNFFQSILLLRQKIEVVTNAAHSIQSKRHPRKAPFSRHSEQSSDSQSQQHDSRKLNPFPKTLKRKLCDSITHELSFKKLRLNSKTSFGQPSAALSFTSRSQEFFVSTISAISLIVNLSGNCNAVTKGVLVSG